MQPNHPDADLIAAYRAFHAHEQQDVPAELNGNDDATEAWCEAHWRRRTEMLAQLEQYQPQTMAGMAVLVLSALHDPDLISPNAQLADRTPSSAFSPLRGLRDESLPRLLTRIAEHALRLAPDLTAQEVPDAA